MWWSSCMIILQCFLSSLSYFLLSTLVSSYMTSTWTAWGRGAPECILSLFEVLYSIVNPCPSEPPHYGLHVYPHPTSLTFNCVHEAPAPSCSSSRSINSEVQVAICESLQYAGTGSVCIDLGPPCTCRYFLFIEQVTQNEHYCIVKKTTYFSSSNPGVSLFYRQQ